MDGRAELTSGVVFLYLYLYLYCILYLYLYLYLYLIVVLRFDIPVSRHSRVRMVSIVKAF